MWGRGAVSPQSRWIFSQHHTAPGKPCMNLSQNPPPTPPAPTGWDRPQPAGLPALINTGQAAKAAAGSILPGGPSSAGVTWGRGPAAWLGGSGGRAGLGRAGKADTGKAPAMLHSITCSLPHPHRWGPQIFAGHQFCTRPWHWPWGTGKTRQQLL